MTPLYFSDLSGFLNSVEKKISPEQQQETLILSGAYWWLTPDNVHAVWEDLRQQWREVSTFNARDQLSPPKHIVLLMNNDRSWEKTVVEHTELGKISPEKPTLKDQERFKLLQEMPSFLPSDGHISVIGHGYTCLAPVFRMMHAAGFQPGWVAKRGYGWRAKSGLPICTGLAFSAATGWATPISLSAVHGIPATAKTHGG